MVSENPTVVGLLAEPELTPRDRVDPVKVAVHVILALYLLPVILLVAVIGLTSIVFSQLATMSAKALGILFGAAGRLPRNISAQRRVIGTRPITMWKQKRSRVIR